MDKGQNTEAHSSISSWLGCGLECAYIARCSTHGCQAEDIAAAIVDRRKLFGQTKIKDLYVACRDKCKTTQVA